jgi:hypothetical protein
MNCVEIWNVWIECANQRNRSRPEFLLSPSPDNLQLVMGWTNSQETSQFSILVEELVTDYSGRLSWHDCGYIRSVSNMVHTRSLCLTRTQLFANLSVESRYSPVFYN